MTGRPKTVLLVEDEVFIATATAKAIRSFGFEVRLADSGEQAIALSTAGGDCDLVLMDINLGKGIDGPEAARRINALKTIPIIFLSSHTEQATVEKVSGVTHYGYVVKNSGDFILRSSIEMAFELFNAQVRMRESEERYRKITSAVMDYFYTVFVEDGVVVKTVHGAACIGVTGYSAEEFLAFPYLWYTMIHPGDRELVARQAQDILAGDNPRNIVHRILRKDGELRWIANTPVLHRGPAGNLVSYDGLVRDITERKQAEERLRRSLEEKEVLLREVHHRVKNNLNIISSLLNLQASVIQTPEQALTAFENSRDRILAMALVHEELYASKDYSRVDMGEYLAKLTKQLQQAYCPGAEIGSCVQAEGIILNVNLAIPCGLILNELITNAFKYAFPKGQYGEISILFRALDDGWYELTVSDNGIGMLVGAVGNDPGSLGLTLVRLLAQQLGGSLDISSVNGTACRIRFPGTAET